MEIQPLPEVRFGPSAPLPADVYSWDALAEALVSIASGKAKAEGRNTRTQRGPAAASSNGSDRSFAASASQNAPPAHARIRSPMRSSGRGAAADLKSPAAATEAASSSPAAAADESLPTGMQLLCSVAWTQVHSPPPNNRAAFGVANVPRTPQQPQSQQMWSTFTSPSRSPVPTAASASPFVSPTPTRRTQMMSPPASSSSLMYARPAPAAAPSASASAAAAAAHFRSPHRFTAPDSADEEEDNEDADSDRSDARSEEDESDQSHDPRMQADSTLDFGSTAHHATLADLTAVAAQQMPRALDPDVFHSASFSVNAAQSDTSRSLSRGSRRSAPFVMRQPVVRTDSDMDDDVAASSEPAPRTDADSLTLLELEYEHLQSALHSLQQDYSEQLAHEIEQKVCELDVALALTLGVEPEPAVLNRLSDPSNETGSSLAVLAQSRELAAQNQVATLPQTLYQRHAASLARFRSHFTPVAEEHRKALSALQAHMQSNESKLSAILDRNHLEVTRKRDEQVRAAIAAAKAAEEARLKKLEEERVAKEAAEKAKAEAEAAAKKAAEEAAAKKAAADKDAKDKSDQALAKAATDSAAAARPVAGPAVAGPSPAAAQEMAARIAHLTACRVSFAGFVASLEMKPARLKIMMTINRAIQQISGTLLQVQSKARELLTLLGMAKAASANSGGDQYHYCLDLIATKIVAQAYAKVRLMHDAAFPFAKVALMIAMEHPLFTDIFLGCLGEKCTYIAPQYLDRKLYKDLPSYMRALGYEFVDPPEGSPPGTPQAPEGEEQYFERMSGYVALYAAFVSEGASVPAHPHGIGAAWVWVARVANQKPRTTTAVILHAFLNQCAWGLHAAYPHQLPKLLHAINNDMLLKLDATTPPRKAAQAVLALWLQTTLHQLQTYGRFEEPKGMTMPHTQEADAGRQEVHEGDRY